MLFEVQRRDVQLRRHIVHDLTVHEGMSVDDSNALALPGLGVDDNETFQQAIVPLSLLHVVATGAPVAGNCLLPSYHRQNTIVALR